MTNKKFRGVYAVSCTPFDDRGAVDEAALRRHLRWLVDEGGVHGVIPAGSTGEFAFLTRAERQQVVEIAIDEVKGRVPLLAGAAACSTRETIEYAQQAQRLGADGVMVVPPYYGHLSQEELFQHFNSLAQNLDIAIMLYNNPGTSGSDILPETVARLAEHKNIAAVKESTGEMQRVHELQDACGERIEVLCGCDTLPLEMFAMGVEGWVAAPSNVIARYCVQLFSLAVEKRDFAAARGLYARLLPLFAMFEGTGQYVQLNKAGLEILGRPIGKPRPPLLAPSAAQTQQLKAILDAIYAQ
jgi:4-hydroxy-tetrahydrodipicolinate synthase